MFSLTLSFAALGPVSTRYGFPGIPSNSLAAPIDASATVSSVLASLLTLVLQQRNGRPFGGRFASARLLQPCNVVHPMPPSMATALLPRLAAHFMPPLSANAPLPWRQRHRQPPSSRALSLHELHFVPSCHRSGPRLCQKPLSPLLPPPAALPRCAVSLPMDVPLSPRHLPVLPICAPLSHRRSLPLPICAPTSPRPLLSLPFCAPSSPRHVFTLPFCAPSSPRLLLSLPLRAPSSPRQDRKSVV